jgi:hypothetical protein
MSSLAFKQAEPEDSSSAYLATKREAFKLIWSKYSLPCIWCGETIEYRISVYWAPGCGSAHPDCFRESHGAPR